MFDMEVPTQNLSKTVRKSKSATDERVSSQVIGVGGAIFVVVVFLAIVILDVRQMRSPEPKKRKPKTR